MPHLTWKKKANVTPASSPYSHQSHPVSHLVLLILLSTSFFLKAIQSPLPSHLPPQLEPYPLLPGLLHKPPRFPISFLLVHSQNRSLRDHRHPIPFPPKPSRHFLQNCYLTIYQTLVNPCLFLSLSFLIGNTRWLHYYIPLQDLKHWYYVHPFLSFFLLLAGSQMYMWDLIP